MQQQPQCVFIANGQLHADQVRAFLAAAGIRSVERGESVRHTHGITVDGIPAKQRVNLLVATRHRNADDGRAGVDERSYGPLAGLIET
jgi:hypothetical protein